MHHDENDEAWRHSGKLTGDYNQEFVDSSTEHHNEVEKDVASSLFCDLDPYKDSPRVVGPKEAIYEYLNKYVAAGWNPREPLLGKFQLDYTEGGLFFFTESESAKVFSLNKLHWKFNDMVAYLFELTYDLEDDPFAIGRGRA